MFSKSNIKRGVQCPKSLYLHKHDLGVKEKFSEGTRALFNRGEEVRRLAQKLFPMGVDASQENGDKTAVQATDHLIKCGENIIYNAAFEHDDVSIVADIFETKGKKHFLYEVKSATKISESYIIDAAIQYLIITNCGIELEDVFVVHINNNYVYRKELKLHKLFKRTSVKARILELLPTIREKIKALKTTFEQPNIPEVGIGLHCFKPYTCDYRKYCWQKHADSPIFEITGMSKEEQVNRFKKGERNYQDLIKDNTLTKNQIVQIDQKKILHKEDIRKCIEKLEYPIQFLDFETVQYAIPQYETTRPYEQLPFQFSIHIIERSHYVTHREFLAFRNEDPRRRFAEQLLEKIEEQGSIVVYDAAFEKMIIKSLARRFPDLKERLHHMLSRIEDLMIPFQKKHYYLPQMKGSHSIKSVLPALISEMSYNDLVIKNGRMATLAYEQLQKLNEPEQIEKIRKNLSDYCKMDTMAMVKIYEKLKELNSPKK